MTFCIPEICIEVKYIVWMFVGTLLIFMNCWIVSLRKMRPLRFWVCEIAWAVAYVEAWKVVMAW